VTFDKTLIAGKLRRWEKYLDEYKLPDWEDIPDIGLYMEQVIALLKYYLDYLPPELKEEQFLTAAAINNYVRKKVMPEPVKKKYYRVHIAYLLIICSLKHSLSIPTLQTMIPVDLSVDELREFYESYVRRHRLAAKYFIAQVREVAAGILDHSGGSEVSTASTAELITTSAVVSGFSRLLAEKLLLLEGKSLEEVGNIEAKRPEK
jgi:hypothetical protein